MASCMPADMDTVMNMLQCPVLKSWIVSKKNAVTVNCTSQNLNLREISEKGTTKGIIFHPE